MATRYFTLTASRIATDQRVAKSTTDDTNVAGAIGDPVIVGIRMSTSKGPIGPRSISLRWRDVTDAGAFIALISSGELQYTESTVLTNDNALLTAERVCSTGVGIFQNGLEVTDGASATFTLSDEYYTEFQFAVDTTNADTGHVYEFEVYDDTMGYSLGTSSQITLTTLKEASISAEIGGGVSSDAGYYESASGPSSFSTTDKAASITNETVNYSNDTIDASVSTYARARSDTSKTSGKWYAEFQVQYTGSQTRTFLVFGIQDDSVSLTLGSTIGGTSGQKEWGGFNNSSFDFYKIHDASQTETISGPHAMDSIGMVAVDIDAGKVWFGINGTWEGDPSAGTGPSFTDADIYANPLFLVGAVLDSLSVAPKLLINADPDNIAYSLPTDFTCWNEVAWTQYFNGDITAGLGAAESTEGAVDTDILADITAGLGGGFTTEYEENLIEAEITAGLGGSFVLGVEQYALFEVDISGGFGGSMSLANIVSSHVHTQEGWSLTDKHADVDISGTYNHEASQNSTTTDRGVRGITAHSTGQLYLEFHPLNNSDTAMPGGVANTFWDLTAITGSDSAGNSWGFYLYDNGDDTVTLYKRYQNTPVALFTDVSPGLSSSDIVMMAVDFDAGKIWFGLRGTWSGDPAAGTGEAYSSITGTLLVAGSTRYVPMMTIVINEALPSYLPSGFEMWGNYADYNLIEEEITAGLGQSAVYDPQTEFGLSLTEGLGVAEIIYEGATQVLAEISAGLGQGMAAPSVAGSTWNAGISGGLGNGADAPSEWNWEETLFRHLDSRHTDLSLGFYPLASVFGEEYFLHFGASTKNYELTMTGGSGPIVLPMISFQAKLRDSLASSLAVQIVGPYAQEVRDRLVGSMRLDVVWMYGSTELARETVVTASITDADIKETSTKTNISVTGSATRAYPGSKEVTLQGIQYESMINGKLRYRASFDAELFPGDSVVAADRVFTADVVSLSVSINESGYVSEQMEVGEGVGA